MSDLDTEVAPDTGSIESTEAPAAPAPAETMRETLERAYTEAETAAEPKPEGAKPPDKGAATATGRVRDGSGRFSSTPRTKADAGQPPQASSTASIAPPEPLQGAQAPPDKAQALQSKAPASWKPLAREKWAALPPEVQQEVHRVDQEVRKVMERSSASVQEAQAFRQAWGPYEGMIRAQNADPVQAAANLFQTAAALRTLPPWPRAQLLAQIITTHSAGDADFQMLSQALAGRQPGPEQQGQSQQGPMQDPRVDQLLERLQRAEEANQGRRLERTQQSIQDWAKDKEFFEDLREDMADFHELAHKRGQAMSYDQSYTAALSLPQNAELRQVLEQRKEAEAAKAALAASQKGRLASSSIRGSPVAAMRNGQPTDMRSALEANWDAAFSGR